MRGLGIPPGFVPSGAVLAPRPLEAIEAQLRALNDRGTPVYYEKCVHPFWIYDPAFPGLGVATGGNPDPVVNMKWDPRAGLSVSTKYAIHRTQPTWTGLAATYDDTTTGARLGSHAFLGLKYNDVQADQAASLFLYDVYEECRRGLTGLAAALPSDWTRRADYCARVGRYGSCLYDAAARPTPLPFVALQNPYPTYDPHGTSLEQNWFTSEWYGDSLIRMDDMEHALGRTLTEADFAVSGQAALVMSLLGATPAAARGAVVVSAGDTGPLSRAAEVLRTAKTNPWEWDDTGPATSTYRQPYSGPPADGYHHPPGDHQYGGGTVLALAYSANRVQVVTVVSGAEYARRAQMYAAYLVPKNFTQFIATEWLGYLRALQPFADAGLLDMSASALQKKQDDALRAKTMGDATSGIGVVGTAGAVVPVVGWIVSLAAGILNFLIGWLPIASGTWPLCPPPFLLRFPATTYDPTATLQDWIDKQDATHQLEMAIVPVVPHVKVKKSSSAAGWLFAGAAALAVGVWWYRRRK